MADLAGAFRAAGLTFLGVTEANPRLVLCRVSGYGQTGPYAERAGFASAAEAMGGIRHINGFPGEPPAEYERMAALMPSLTHLEPPNLIRLGLEDYPYAEQGCPTTAELIEQFVPLVEAMGLTPATPDEAREYLGLR